MSGFFDMLSGIMGQDKDPPAQTEKQFGNLAGGLAAAGATLGGNNNPLAQAPLPKPKEAAPVPPVPAPLPAAPNLQLTMPQMGNAPQMPAPPPPPVPGQNLQLTMPQVQPQFQLGQPMIYSDKNLKTNISNTSQADIKKFIKSIAKPKNYDYKDSANGSNTKGGLMAQDLEKSKIGKSVVVNTPKGKAVNAVKLAAIMTSVTANRLTEFENKMETALNDRFKKGKK